MCACEVVCGQGSVAGGVWRGGGVRLCVEQLAVCACEVVCGTVGSVCV